MSMPAHISSCTYNGWVFQPVWGHCYYILVSQGLDIAHGLTAAVFNLCATGCTQILLGIVTVQCVKLQDLTCQ